MKKLTQYITIAVTALFFVAASAGAMTFKTEDMGELQLNAAFKASFGATQYLDFVDDYSSGDDADFDATRELSLKAQWILNKNLKGVVSFQIGEGRSQGGYFGSVDAVVGGEEDGDIILELDNLYIDYTTDSGMNFKIGSQSYNMGEIAYGSNLMYEVPAGVTFSTPLNDMSKLQAGWFRMTDLMDDSKTNTEDQADLLFAKLPITMNALQFTPWVAYANIQEDVIANAPSHYRYAYINYPGLLTGANGAIADPTPTDDVSAWYLGMTFGYTMDELSVKASATYGDMDWETAAVDSNIAGYFADIVIDYKMDGFTPEFFAFYGNGPDANDEDLNMMPMLIAGPTYTSSFFGGSRFNDNMFDSHDTTVAVSMWAVGFKVKDIKTGDKLSHEFQIMYAEGTAEDSIFESPNDILMNEDESVVEINFNSEYQIMKHLVFATELGYMTFDEDSDYDEAVNGSVEDFWKVACAIELSF